MAFESVRRLYQDFFKSGNNNDRNGCDKRKREYGNLNDVRNRRIRTNVPQRQRMHRKSLNKYRDYNDNYLSNQRHKNTVSSTNVPSKGRITRVQNQVSNLIRGLKMFFSNDTENISNMRVACENFSLLSGRNNPNSYHDRNSMIRDRIQKSRSFKKKLAERDYDKRQLEILKQSPVQIKKRQPYFNNENNNNIQLNNDKVLLLQRQNRRLRKELLERESEIRILKKELRFLKENENLMNKDEILNLLSADSHTIENFQDNNSKNDNFNMRNDQDKFDELEERSRSFSPVRIDYSQYSR